MVIQNGLVKAADSSITGDCFFDAVLLLLWCIDRGVFVVFFDIFYLGVDLFYDTSEYRVAQRFLDLLHWAFDIYKFLIVSTSIDNHLRKQGQYRAKRDQLLKVLVAPPTQILIQKTVDAVFYLRMKALVQTHLCL